MARCRRLKLKTAEYKKLEEAHKKLTRKMAGQRFQHATALVVRDNAATAHSWRMGVAFW